MEDHLCQDATKPERTMDRKAGPRGASSPLGGLIFFWYHGFDWGTLWLLNGLLWRMPIFDRQINYRNGSGSIVMLNYQRGPQWGQSMTIRQFCDLWIGSSLPVVSFIQGKNGSDWFLSTHLINILVIGYHPSFQRWLNIDIMETSNWWKRNKRFLVRTEWAGVPPSLSQLVCARVGVGWTT